MKLTYRIILRLSFALLVLLSVWAGFFYYRIVDEINDEVDDTLENYSEQIIIRMLAGEPLPQPNNGSNNSYSIKSVTEAYAAAQPRFRYADANVFIPEAGETEPARVLRTLFEDHKGGYFELTVATPGIEKHDLREAILQWIIILYVALLLTILMVNAWVISRSMRPLYVLLRWLDDFHLGVSASPLENPTSVTEFRRLNQAVVRSIQRAEESFEQQKQFIGNASHEMQTPLAVLANRVEWLIDRTTPTPEQLAELVRVQQTIRQAVRLNRSLLLLSKIDNGQYPEVSEVDMNALLREQTEASAEVYAARDISITLDQQAHLSVRMNESLAAILTSNLLRNACLHSPAGSGVQVEVTERAILFRNPAAEGPLDAAHIFDRFYQGARRAGSAGLGLAIAEAICRLYGVHIGYVYKDGMHCFRVEWP